MKWIAMFVVFTFAVSAEVKKEAVQSDKEFKVINEAKLPKGFPGPGPVNEIVLKDYPDYRAAKVESGRFQNMSFMILFGHIKRNKIAMTAPVEMTLNKDGQRQDMSFLYGNPEIGKPGKERSGVNVVDLPAREYLSIGVRGSESVRNINKAIKKLEKWLADNEKYTGDGEHRLLGYNSPMVPASKRFWEVQIPVKKLNSGK